MQNEKLEVQILDFDGHNISICESTIMLTFGALTMYPKISDIRIEEIDEECSSLIIDYSIIKISREAHHDLSNFLIENGEV